MAAKPYLLHVYRGNKWQQILSSDLLPDDVVSIPRHDPNLPDQVCPCDILLMHGKAVTNEALLTGESTPQMKESVQDAHQSEPDSTLLELKKKDKRHIIFGGTRVLQAWPQKSTSLPPTPDKGCVGIVLRTGFETMQGKLLRTILYATERVTANNVEALLFICFLLVFAVCASAYVMYKGLMDPARSRYKLFLNCTLIITSVVPPELPMELSMAVNTSLLALSKLGVFCTEPFRIPFAGRVRVCCFDKTGTLTSDKMNLKKIVRLENSRDDDEARIVLSGCHSLIELEGKMLGDPMEQAGVIGSDFKFASNDDSSNDTMVSATCKSCKKINILKRFAFDSDLKRMSTVASVNKNITALVKGAPESLKSMIKISSLPKDYDDIVRELTLQGGRVIALANRSLEPSNIDRLTRDEVERDLNFVAFAVFESDIKPQTLETVQALMSSAHRVIMITGDNPLTACHVARQLNMVSRPLLVLSRDGETCSFFDQSGNVIETFTQDGNQDQIVTKLTKTHDLCVSGEALTFLQRKHLHDKDAWMDVYARRTIVFARVSPDQKELVLTSLKNQGYFTVMCGDGTNDVGALKQAHVGIALIDQAAPSTTTTPNGTTTGVALTAPTIPPSQPPAATTATDKKLSFAERLEEMRRLQKEAAEMQDNNMVRLGDASIASPFTSKVPNIAATVNIIRQGRCTLATTMQMYKILALNCLVSAYSLSVLYLDGVKFGDAQMIITGFGITLCFLFISRSRPVQVLSTQRPHTRIFSCYMMTSIMGQFIIHLVTLYLCVQSSKLSSPPDLQISKSIGTEKERTFEPNLLNTVVFVVTSMQTVVTFVNNYCGRPFMESLFENKGLLVVLSGVAAACLTCASGVMPALNEQLELVEIQDESFRSLLLIMLVGNMVAVAVYEKLCSFLFPAPDDNIVM
ncbi:hypothetical protein AKO1_011618 [Acrasis kona]|uniref:P-type ATPase A domain-containing protein n=1 Tax=Acrasis kona TaxID=1008807 RepID=A0AAW2Z6K7_9EUKA